MFRLILKYSLLGLWTSIKKSPIDLAVFLNSPACVIIFVLAYCAWGWAGALTAFVSACAYNLIFALCMVRRVRVGA